MASAKEPAEKKDRLKPLRIIKNIVLGVLIAFLTAVLIMSVVSRASDKTPSLFGYSLFRVSSGSMSPELEVGDVILVKSCDGSDVKNGEIVTYLATSGEMSGRMITHRVIKEPYLNGDEYYIVTKGDANESSDDPVKTSQIEGRFLYKIGILKYLFDFFVTPWGLLAIIVLILLAFSNEIVVFVKSLFGIGYDTDDKERVEEIIERYQRENQNKSISEKSGESGETEQTTSNSEE